MNDYAVVFPNKSTLTTMLGPAMTMASFVAASMNVLPGGQMGVVVVVVVTLRVCV